MPPELIQLSLNNLTVIVVGAVAFLLVAVLVVFLLVRSNTGKREVEARVGQRLLEIEREAQFAASADHLPHRRKPAEVRLQIAGLLREYLSMEVLAVYAGREGDSRLEEVVASSEEHQPSPSITMPASVPASLLQKHARPVLINLASIANQESPFGLLEEQSVAGQAEAPQQENALGPRAEETQIVPSASRDFNDAIVLPWHGPFRWSGLIVATNPAAITVERLEPYRMSLTRLSDRIALALEFEHCDAALEAFDQRAARTASFSRALIANMEGAAPLDGLLREVTTLVGSDSAALWRVDEATSMVRMVAAHGLRSYEFLPLPLGQGLAGYVAQSGEMVALEDAPGDPRCIFPREARESGIVSYLGAPLASDGKSLGTIEVHSSSRRSWTDNEKRALESAATIIGEIVKSTDSRGNRLRVESAYLGLSEALQRLRSPDEVKEAVVEVLGHALGASRVLAVEFDDKNHPEPVKQEYRQQSAKSALGATFGEELATAVTSLPGSQSIAISDSREKSLAGPGAAVEFGLLSELAVPIRQEGKTKAIIYVHQCDRVREWKEDEIEFAERVVRQLSLSLSNLRSLELAFRDASQARNEARRSGAANNNAEAMLSELPEVIIGLDAENKLSFFNAAAKDRLGLTGDDLGRTLDETKSATVGDKSVWEKLTTCQSVMRFSGEMKVGPGANGEGIPVSISAAPVRDDRGEIGSRLIVAADLSHVNAAGAAAKLKELEQKLQSLERVLAQSRNDEEQTRAMLAKASALEAKARAEADVARRVETEARQQLDRIKLEHKQVQDSAKQLLEINRLKSEFIVNAGHEIEASLQSVLGLAELLERGSYGSLTPEQREAAHGIYGWARRIKSDVDWLIEYGSTRSRRLESSTGS